MLLEFRTEEGRYWGVEEDSRKAKGSQTKTDEHAKDNLKKCSKTP
jgi:hypothetical protein